MSLYEIGSLFAYVILFVVGLFVRSVHSDLRDLERDVKTLSEDRARVGACLVDLQRQVDRMEQTINLIWADLKGKADRL